MTPPKLLTRNEYGLIEGVEYKFEDSGFVDWRSLISPEFLYPNKDAFKDGKVPESIEGLEDHQLLCKLGGYKELARLRGFNSVYYKLDHIRTDHVSAICTIDWIPNFEVGEHSVSFSSTANATENNTSDFGGKFLETIAENRAFVRCVRNFLNIHIVGADEVDKSKNKVADDTPGAQEPVSNPLPNLNRKLRDKLASQGLTTKDQFKAKLKELSATGKFEYSDKWEACADIPTKEVRIILGLLS